jgi:hypothetical protein
VAVFIAAGSTLGCRFRSSGPPQRHPFRSQRGGAPPRQWRGVVVKGTVGSILSYGLDDKKKTGTPTAAGWVPEAYGTLLLRPQARPHCRQGAQDFLKQAGASREKANALPDSGRRKNDASVSLAEGRGLTLG